MTFGEKLQALRKARGWSQEELATQINVSRQALSKWESGASVPDTENVVALSRLFGLRIWASTLPPTVVYNGSDRVGELTGMRNLTETYDVGWLVFLTWFLLLLGLAGTVLYKQLREFFFGGWLK